MIAMNQNTLSPRALDVLTRFDLSPRDARLTGNRATPPSPAAAELASGITPGTITLITGPSGSGKTTLLHAVESHTHRPMIDLGAVHLPDTRVIDCLAPMPVEHALEWLGRFGLGEVWCYLSPASQLSEGERFRLRLAIAVHRAGQVAARQGSAIVIADEFANSLDRITARIVSRNLRRVVTGTPIAAILATAHEDLEPALVPDSTIHCNFGDWQVQGDVPAFSGSSAAANTAACPVGVSPTAGIGVSTRVVIFDVSMR